MAAPIWGTICAAAVTSIYLLAQEKADGMIGPVKNPNAEQNTQSMVILSCRK